MIAFARRLLLGLAIWLGAGALALAQPAAAAAPAPERQILVMFRMPPPHFRGNSDYGGSYGDAAGHAARLRLARAIAREHGLALDTDWAMPVLELDCFVMRVPAGVSAQDAASSVSRHKEVAWAQPMNLYLAQSGPAPGPGHADPLFRVQPAAAAWRLNDLHQMATGRSVRVAVIDSMVDARHPDLAGQIQVSANFMALPARGPEQHGTGVAGVIAARADNAQGIVGVAPGARLLALRACAQLAGGGPSPPTLCDSFSLAKALVFAVERRAQVINMSLSGPPDRLLSALIDVAQARGSTVVAAFDRDLPGGGFPASHPGVVAVSDTSLGAPASVYAAPGRDVPTTLPGGGFGFVNGSSYAAAHVSGLFALLRELGDGKTTTLVALRRGGGIDACATLVRAAEPCGCACAEPWPQLGARR